MPLEPSSNFTQASSWANDWETLFYYEVGIFIFFSVLIFSLILYFAIKYRRRPGNEAAPPTKDHLPLRSEERRVGKECRSRRSRDHTKTKKKDEGRTDSK